MHFHFVWCLFLSHSTRMLLALPYGNILCFERYAYRSMIIWYVAKPTSTTTTTTAHISMIIWAFSPKIFSMYALNDENMIQLESSWQSAKLANIIHMAQWQQHQERERKRMCESTFNRYTSYIFTFFFTRCYWTFNWMRHNKDLMEFFPYNISFVFVVGIVV